MTPLLYLEALELYEREGGPRTLEIDVELHLKNPLGYVLKRPTCFLLARPTPKTHAEWIVNPYHFWTLDVCTNWHVYLLVGHPADAFKFMPFDLSTVSWERNNVLRFYPLHRIKALFTSTSS